MTNIYIFPFTFHRNYERIAKRIPVYFQRVATLNFNSGKNIKFIVYFIPREIYSFFGENNAIWTVC